MVGENRVAAFPRRAKPPLHGRACAGRDLVVLDESFAALDPENLNRAYAASSSGPPPCSLSPTPGLHLRSSVAIIGKHNAEGEWKG